MATGADAGAGGPDVKTGGGRGGKDEVKLTVVAVDADDRCFKWVFNLDSSAAVQVAIKKWASTFGIPTDAVGLETTDGSLVDAEQTPKQLGWTGAVELRSVPLDASFAEGGTPTADDASRTASPSAPAAPAAPAAGASAASAAPPAKKAKPAPSSSAPSAPAAPAASASAAASAASASSPASAASASSPAAASVKPVAAAARGAASSAPAKATPAKASSSSSTTAASSSSAKAAAKKTAAASSSASSPKAAAAQGKKRPAPTPGEGDFPKEDEPVTFQKSNPKRQGTLSHARYEKYCKAKTPSQALKLGAEKGDLTNDFKKGYMTRR